MKKRYTVLTYIFSNYEPVREILEKDPDAEYVLVTDDLNLKSDTWNVLTYENHDDYNAYDKVCDLRLNTFRYCKTDICIRLDASIQIKHSLKLLVDMFEDGKYDIAFSPSPSRDNVVDEFNTWIKVRNYNPDHAKEVLDYFKKNNYDFNYKGLYQGGFTITRNNDLTKRIKEDTYNLVKLLGEDGHMERVDQIPFTYVMNTKYNNIKVLPLSEQILHSYYMQIYQHNSNNYDGYIEFDLRKEEKKYLFNKLETCKYLDTPESAIKEREYELLKHIERIEEEVSRLKIEVNQLRNSNSYKLGQKILYIPGLIKNKRKK